MIEQSEGASCVLFSFVLGSIFSVFVAVKFIKLGLHGIQNGVFPLTDKKNITGLIAKVAGGTLVFLGLLTIISAIVVSYVCFSLMK